MAGVVVQLDIQFGPAGCNVSLGVSRTVAVILIAVACGVYYQVSVGVVISSFQALGEQLGALHTLWNPVPGWFARKFSVGWASILR